MFKELYNVKTTARTVAGINRAIEKATGEAGWLEDEADLKRQINEGFIELKPGEIIVNADEG